jgi:serine/threonine-protein kinase
VDHRADLYSLGIVFYNMVTGSHAFDGPSYSDVLVAICTETLPDIRSAAPWLPAPLGTWFDKACARERENRFQSADEMIEALQAAAGPEARMTRPSVPDEVGGPSGTLVGFAPPDSARTIIAADHSSVAAAVATALESARGVSDVSFEGAASSGSTLRSSDRATPEDTDGVEPPPARANLWLWAATGAGLAVATMALVLAFGGSTTTADSVPKAGEVAAIPAPTIAQAVPIPSLPETGPHLTPPVTAGPAADAKAGEATPDSTAKPPSTSALRPEPAATSTARRASSPPRHAVPVGTATRPSPAPSPPKPAPASATPDMGF